jgi:hypothetical protein
LKIRCEQNDFERGKVRKLNCWEFKKCGREQGGSHIHELGICPAATSEKLDGLHGGMNGGRACWFVVGTLCNGDVQGTYAKKYRSCIYCDFYKAVKEEEYSRSQLEQEAYS